MEQWPQVNSVRPRLAGIEVGPDRSIGLSKNQGALPSERSGATDQSDFSLSPSDSSFGGDRSRFHAGIGGGNIHALGRDDHDARCGRGHRAVSSPSTGQRTRRLRRSAPGPVFGGQSPTMRPSCRQAGSPSLGLVHFSLLMPGPLPRDECAAGEREPRRSEPGAPKGGLLYPTSKREAEDRIRLI